MSKSVWCVHFSFRGKKSSTLVLLIKGRNSNVRKLLRCLTNSKTRKIAQIYIGRFKINKLKAV